MNSEVAKLFMAKLVGKMYQLIRSPTRAEQYYFQKQEINCCLQKLDLKIVSHVNCLRTTELSQSVTELPVPFLQSVHPSRAANNTHHNHHPAIVKFTPVVTMSPALPEAAEQKYQKTEMVMRSPNMMKRILRKKEDKDQNR